MASPHQFSDESRTTSHSSPSRRSSSSRDRERANEHHQPGRRDSSDISQHLVGDIQRILISDERAFQHRLNEQSRRQQKLQVEALGRALAEHEAVRQSAEQAKEQWELDLQRACLKREEEQRKLVDEARRKLAEEKEAQRKREEQARQQEEERKRREDQRREREEAEKRAEAEALKKEQEERARQQAEAQEKKAAEQKAREEAAAQTKQREESQRKAAEQATMLQTSRETGPPTTNGQPRPIVNGVVPAGLVSTQHERDRAHNAYLDIHKRLKRMRQEVPNACKNTQGLKDQVSNWRRRIATLCGTLNKTDKASNTRVTNEITSILDSAAQITQPSIDISAYIVSDPTVPSGNHTQGSGVLLFLLNHFSKKVISFLIGEAAVDTSNAEPLGILVALIFSKPQYQLENRSLIDIFWAKLHVSCPVLFGVSGSEDTPAGRRRLGWALEPQDSDDGPAQFILPEAYYSRLRGLSYGFAAVTLRDFSKSRNRNPAPKRMYWEALARIVNTPSAEQQPSHYVVLGALLHPTFLPRFLQFFGQAALAVLRKATVDFPATAPSRNEEMKLHVRAIKDMPFVLQRNLQLTL